jgi:hypothetical protein
MHACVCATTSTHALEGSMGLEQATEGLEGGQPLMAGYVSASTPIMWSKALANANKQSKHHC